MTKITDAVCAAKVVTIDGMPEPLAEILSDGTGPSTGIALIDKDKVYYLALNTSDLSSTLQHIIDIITQINLAFTAINATIIGPVTAPMITQLTAIQTLITTLKATLK
jgi:hypothetical protein